MLLNVGSGGGAAAAPTTGGAGGDNAGDAPAEDKKKEEEGMRPERAYSTTQQMDTDRTLQRRRSPTRIWASACSTKRTRMDRYWVQAFRTLLRPPRCFDKYSQRF